MKASNGGGIIIASKTYTADTETVVSGAPLSVGSDKVVVAGVTHSLPSQPPPTPRPVLIGGETIAVAPSHGGVIIASKTYTPGAEAKISDIALSVGLDEVVVGGTAHHLPSIQAPVSPTPKPVLVGGHTVAVAPQHGGVIIAGQTYTPGARAEISGTILSVGSDKAVIGSSSYDLPSISDVNCTKSSNTSKSLPETSSLAAQSTGTRVVSEFGGIYPTPAGSSSSNIAPTSRSGSGPAKALLVSVINRVLGTTFALLGARMAV